MADNLSLESFHDADGAVIGVLARRHHPTSLSTLTCFTTPEGLYHVLNRIEMDDADPFHWTHVVQHGEGSDYLEREHTADDPARTVPSFGELLLVQRVLDGTDRELRFTRLDESSGALRPASLVRDGDEVCLYVDGRPTNRHLLSGGRVVESSWNGATSRPAADASELLPMLDDRVAAHLLAFLGE